MLEGHDLRGTGLYALTALQAVGMQIADGLAASVVRRELHRADTGTILTFHLAGT